MRSRLRIWHQLHLLSCPAYPPYAAPSSLLDSATCLFLNYDFQIIKTMSSKSNICKQRGNIKNSTTMPHLPQPLRQYSSLQGDERGCWQGGVAGLATTFVRCCFVPEITMGSKTGSDLTLVHFICTKKVALVVPVVSSVRSHEFQLFLLASKD